MEQLSDHCGIGGVVTVTHRRAGEVIEQFSHPNMVTDEGLNLLLNITFSGAPVPAGSAWYLGLRGNGEQLAGNTMASHAWSEFTGYEGQRPLWTHGPSTQQRTVSSAPASYAIQGGESIIRGAFLTDIPTKGAATGRLFMVANFGRALILYPGDIAEVSYDLRVGRA